MEYACLVCGEKATVVSLGFSFCDEHKKYTGIDPESLEMLVIWRFEGKSTKEIERLLDERLESV